MIKCPKCQNEIKTFKEVKLKNVTYHSLVCCVCGWDNRKILDKLLDENEITAEEINQAYSKDE